MALDAFIVLESLHCLREADLISLGGSEPYLWPVMVRIDDLTIQREELVVVVAPSPTQARVIIKDSMRAGQTADIPTNVGLLRTRLEDNLFETRLLLIAALWDGDETPEGAVRAGYQAFVSEVGAAIGDGPTLLAIKDAEDRDDEAAKQAIVKTIQDRVKARVTSAISGKLTTGQKLQIKTGFLNLDDLLGSAFRGFSDALPKPFSVRFGRGTINDFEVKGRIEVREVLVDICGSQVKAVQSAQAAVNDVQQAIKQLQAELRQASPAEKPFILSEIRRLREEELEDAQAALTRALAALSICRSRLPTNLPTENELVRSAP